MTRLEALIREAQKPWGRMRDAKALGLKALATGLAMDPEEDPGNLPCLECVLCALQAGYRGKEVTAMSRPSSV